MSSSWIKCSIGDVVKLTQGLAINAKTKHLLKDTGLPLLRITDLLNNTEEQFVDEKNAPQKCIVNLGDLIYTRTGQVGYIFNNRHGVVHNNCFTIEPTVPDLTKDYIYWFLKQKRIKEYAESIASGSVQKDLNHGAFNSIPFLYPKSIPTQKKIAHILSTLDDKIELNRKMNQTLEEMASAIFKSWFVDFDPVYAKANCEDEAELETIAKELGVSKAILDLFPSEFIESELGMIPKGWEIINLSEHIEVIKGKSYKSDELQDSKTALVTLKSFLRGGGYRTDGLKPYIGSYKKEQVVKPGEMIIAYTDVTQSADVIGKPAIVLDDENIDIFVASLDVGIVRIKTDDINLMFLYQLFRTPSFQGYILGHTSGTTVLHLSKSWLENFVSFVPNNILMRKFQDITQPLFDKFNENIKQIKTLEKTRDTLLPKLLSGEIDVSELEIK